MIVGLLIALIILQVANIYITFELLDEKKKSDWLKAEVGKNGTTVDIAAFVPRGRVIRRDDASLYQEELKREKTKSAKTMDK